MTKGHGDDIPGKGASKMTSPFDEKNVLRVLQYVREAEGSERPR